MIDIYQLLESVDDNRDDSSKYEAARRLLYSTARRYNRTCEELERLRESTGFNKPFPILRLPREIRDEIYTYSLRAAIAVETTLQRPLIITDRDNPFKPPTSGLLRTNKQIYHEAIEFQEPGQLFAFEEQIGFENRNRVREISIWTRFPGRDEVVLDPEYLARSKYDSVPSHWIAALKICSLGKIVHLRIKAEMIGSDLLSLLSMPKDLQEFIIEFLGRVTDDEIPRLSLTGFREDEREKFPKRWEVVMDQWNSYKDEIRGMQMEWEECSDSQWTFDIGNFEDEEVVDVEQ
ncbi:ethyl tert-butyl ether degradation ethd protein [Rutstroemia sp. NJR-2017a WRK4]|nr:ethyl tert-butyl ether degradation ethd protein [Rutstroemia sp. NJR-2017a WRK4]